MAIKTNSSSALKDEGMIFSGKEGKGVVNLNDHKNDLIDIEIDRISQRASDNLKGTENLKGELKTKIRTIINEDEIKTSKEEVEDLIKTIKKESVIEDDGTIGLEAKKIKIEIDNLVGGNPDELNKFRKKEFNKNFVDEVKKVNPKLDEETLKKVDEYSNLIADSYFENSGIEDQKDVAFEANRQFGPGKLENGWSDLRTTVNFLKKAPNEINKIKEKYNSIKNTIQRIKIPDHLQPVRSFENVVSTLNKPSDGLFSKTKSHLKNIDRIDKLTGGVLRRTAVKAGQNFVSKIGNQTVREFATNSLNVISQQGFSQGFNTVLNGVLSGGVKAVATETASGAAVAGGAATAAGAAGTGAAVAGGAAVSATGVGAIVVAAVAAVKVTNSIKDKVAETLGVSTKSFWQQYFGKTGGKVVDKITKPIILIFIIVFAYQNFTSCSVSGLVPPEGADEYEETYDDLVSDEVPTPPTDEPSGGTATGQAIVDTAKSTLGHICYYFAGGHNHNDHYVREPMKGFDPYWGKEKYVGTDGNTYTFGWDGSGKRMVYSTDCSSFVEWVYYQNGKNLGSVTASDLYFGVDPSMRFTHKANLQAGDIGVAWHDGNGNGKVDPYYYDSNGVKKHEIYHIGIYAGYTNSYGPVWIHDGSTGYLGGSRYNKNSLCYSPYLGYVQPGYVKEGNNSDFTLFARILK